MASTITKKPSTKRPYPYAKDDPNPRPAKQAKADVDGLIGDKSSNKLTYQFSYEAILTLQFELKGGILPAAERRVTQKAIDNLWDDIKTSAAHLFIMHIKCSVCGIGPINLPTETYATTHRFNAATLALYYDLQECLGKFNSRNRVSFQLC